MIKQVGSSPVTQTHHPTPAHGGKLPEWAKGISKLVKAHQADLSRFTLSDAAVKTTPKGVQDFYKQVQGALPDDDGTGAVLKFPLKDVSPGHKGSAFAVRWTSEDTKLDRLWLFDDKGKQIAKGWTDTGGALSWAPAKKPFTIDDSPHHRT